MRETCDSCKYSQVIEQDLKKRTCNFEPPKLLQTVQGIAISRPVVASDDTACHHHLPRVIQ